MHKQGAKREARGYQTPRLFSVLPAWALTREWETSAEVDESQPLAEGKDVTVRWGLEEAGGKPAT